MKTSKLLILLLALPILAFTQNPTQSIRGTIINKDTRQPIEGVKVMTLDMTPPLGAITNAEGVFRIAQVPTGRVRLMATHINFDSVTTDNLRVNSAKELIVDMEMNEAVMTMDGVVISYGESPVEAISSFDPVSRRSFRVEETQRYAGTVNDPGRMAMGFAGVQASQDNNSDIIIRGNSPVGLLWRLEGIDIPNPNHFARKGSSGGGITIFSAQVLGNSDFATGAFSAPYGNALSGVFDMNFRRGNTENREYRLKAGLLGLDFATEGPIKKGKSSYLVNYRYSTLGILNDIGFRLVGERIDNNFQDLSFNLYLPTKNPNTSFTVFGLGGLSEELWDPVEDSLTWSRPYRTTRDYLTRMGAGGVTFTHLIDDKSFIKAVVAVMGDRVVDNDDTLNISSISPNPDPGILETTTDWKSLQESPFEKEEYLNSRISSHVYYSRRLSPKAMMQTGVLASHIRFQFSHEQRIPDSSAFETLVSGADNSNLLQGYAQFRFTPTDRLSINAGLHAMALTLNQTTSLEPRLSMKYRVNEKISLSAAYGIHSQILPLGNYFTSIQGAEGMTMPNLGLEMPKAHHAVIGYEHLFDNNLRFLVEGYYQRLFDLPITPTSAPSDYMLLNERDGYATQALSSDGTGVNMGVDVTFEKFFSNGVFFLWNGSLYESNYTASDGNTYSTRYNSRYNTSLMGGTEFAAGKGGSIQLGARTVLNGGLRYTPGDEVQSREAQEFVAKSGAAFTEGVGEYFRIDLRAAYRKNLKKSAYTISLDVQNATNRRNVRDQIYDPGYNQLVNRFQSGLIPVISFQIDF